MNRVIAYIDGFNLYFGMREKGWRRYYWLDVHCLAQRLLKPHQELAAVRYFTSRVSASPSDPNQAKRQGVYIEALETLAGTSLHYGHYLTKTVKCFKCGAEWRTNEEKMTDVNIAIALMEDAFLDALDTALLISGDSDLVGPVVQVKKLYPNKSVVIAFPPERTSARLRQEADDSFVIGRKVLKESQLPDEIRKPNGFILKRPDSWR
jgi:uncharacterized LabA/DUF88 family protein